MSNNDEARIIRVPNLLRAKIGTAPGPGLDQIVAQAEAALDGLHDNYEGWIRDYPATLTAALAEARAAVPVPPTAVERMRKISHEIKGQGETFGYPLLTQVGRMLQGFIERDAPAAARHLDLLEAYVDFMNLVVRDGIHDQGGPAEQRLLGALEAATRKVTKA